MLVHNIFFFFSFYFCSYENLTMIKKNIFNIVKRDGIEKEKNEYYAEMVRIRDECFASNSTNTNYYFAKPNAVVDENTMYCPTNFDGRMCWSAIPAGAVAIQPCPEYLVGPGVVQNVTKKCLEDGYWYTKIGEMRPWASYLECYLPDNEEFDTLVKDIFYTGTVTALICLVMTIMVLIIFKFIKHLKVKLHYRLLGALLFDNFFFIGWFHLVVVNSEARLDKMITARPDIVKKIICLLGWLTTTFFIAVRAAKRNNEGRQYPLWMVPTGKHWLHTMPIVVMIYVAFFALVHSVTVIAANLFGSPNDSYIVDLLYVMKAPFVLIPICGVHFLLVPFNPPETNIMYQYCKNIMSSIFVFLAACVSFLLHNDLTIAIRYRMTRYHRFRHAYPIEGAFDFDLPEREHIN